VTRHRPAGGRDAGRLGRLSTLMSLALLGLWTPGTTWPVHASAPRDAEPALVVRRLVTDVLDVLRDKGTVTAERQRKLRALIAPVFDFATMSRFALGYHWRDLTPEQRTEFVGVFSHFIQDSYLTRINEYSGQEVEFGKVQLDGADYAQVHTRIIDPGKPSTAVNYRLEHARGAWRIYDVTVDNLSILANYRNQFARVMNKDGYATLIRDLRKKQRALAASLGDGT
jgi:phospholipid transport system substrate-binding protein